MLSRTASKSSFAHRPARPWRAAARCVQSLKEPMPDSMDPLHGGQYRGDKMESTPSACGRSPHAKSRVARKDVNLSSIGAGGREKSEAQTAPGHVQRSS